MPAEVPILSSVSFTVALGYGIVAPSIPAFARQFGVSAAAAGAVISAFALMRIVGALPAGRLVGRLGERRAIAIGILIVAVSSLLAGFSGSFVQLIVLRGIGGLGSVMFGVGAQTLLLGCVRPDQRGRASGLYSGGFLLGGISGPAIGGLVAAWSLRAPFFIYGFMLLVPAGIAFTVLRDRPRQVTQPDQDEPDQDEPDRDKADRDEAGGRAGRSLLGLGDVLRSRVYQAAAAANLADGFAVLGVRAAIVPLFVKEVLHRSPAWTGIGFGVVAALNAATLIPAGSITDKVGRRPVIVAGCLGSAAAMVTLAFVPGLAGFLISMTVLGVGSGLLDVAPSAMVGDLLGQEGRASERASARRRPGGMVIASYQMAGDIGAVTGPVAVGYLVDSASYTAAFCLGAGVFGGGAGCGGGGGDTTRPESDRPESDRPASAADS
jgi:MFS transporter, DHA1 family, multidrug resistance protein